MMLLHETFKQTNKEPIIQQSLPSCLYQYHIERLTIYDKNNYNYKFFCKPIEGTNLTQLDSHLKASFTQNYGSGSDQYMKLSMKNSENKLILTI